MAEIRRVLETCLYVSDIDTAEAFYGRLFSLATYAREGSRHVFFKLQDGMLLLFNPDETVKESELPSHGAHGPGHIAFCIEHSELEKWRARLDQFNMEIEKEMQWPSGGRSIYFRDPFDNSVELATSDTWP